MVTFLLGVVFYVFLWRFVLLSVRLGGRYLFGWLYCSLSDNRSFSSRFVGDRLIPFIFFLLTSFSYNQVLFWLISQTYLSRTMDYRQLIMGDLSKHMITAIILYIIYVFLYLCTRRETDKKDDSDHNSSNSHLCWFPKQAKQISTLTILHPTQVARASL